MVRTVLEFPDHLEDQKQVDFNESKVLELRMLCFFYKSLPEVLVIS